MRHIIIIFTDIMAVIWFLIRWNDHFLPQFSFFSETKNVFSHLGSEICRRGHFCSTTALHYNAVAQMLLLPFTWPNCIFVRSGLYFYCQIQCLSIFWTNLVKAVERSGLCTAQMHKNTFSHMHETRIRTIMFNSHSGAPSSWLSEVNEASSDWTERPRLELRLSSEPSSSL